ncbi:MAG TPA: MauE/DoxX family redox-associated membrane protein [Nocardioidaceae bacterium]|nr:MauE/DoxX family redox-associated membrane protein [Nocardioidaceae bacterium]
MLDQVAALQPLLVGAVLMWTGSGKAFGRLAEARSKRSALPRLVGEQRAYAAYRATGGVELVVAAALLLPPWWSADALAADALATGFVGYLTYAKLAAPDASCGCLGSAALPVSWRSLARAGLLVAASASILVADEGWPAMVGDDPVVTAGVLVAEFAVFVVVSPELDRRWLLPLRRAYVRLTHPLAAADPTVVPLAATVQQLERSPAYGAVAGALRSDIRDHWDDGDWRFVCYTAEHGETEGLAVFAIPLGQYEPDAVRVAIVDEDTGTALYRPEPAPA